MTSLVLVLVVHRLYQGHDPSSAFAAMPPFAEGSTSPVLAFAFPAFLGDNLPAAAASAHEASVASASCLVPVPVHHSDCTAAPAVAGKGDTGVRRKGIEEGVGLGVMEKEVDGEVGIEVVGWTCCDRCRWGRRKRTWMMSLLQVR